MLLGYGEPRIGVCGINRTRARTEFWRAEEEEKIVPAVERCRKRVVSRRTVPADTLFYLAANGRFDLVVAMYHDQGHVR